MKKILGSVVLSLSVCLLVVNALNAKTQKEPEKKFQIINHDLTAYTVYFGCQEQSTLKNEVGPGETLDLDGNDKACHIMIRPSAQMYTKLFQKTCDLAATITITNGKAEMIGCVADEKKDSKKTETPKQEKE